MTVDQRALLTDLQKQVRMFEDDIRDRAAAAPEVAARLQTEHAEALRVGRTAASYGEWRDALVVQAAVGWVLGTVFVRFCEDNRLVDEAWIAGPGERLREAGERQTQFLVDQPHLNDRDWLLAAFGHLADFPAVAALFNREHNPLYRLEISADGAESLVGFWRRRDDHGHLVHDFTDPELSTRFLGDLYQDLSEAARKAFALLQTPEFVEELILDLTLDPAIDTFGLENLKLIDPTCGSGHFLLGAFDRLLDAWTRQAPGMPVRDRVQKALGSVHGVDINPFATAIARFRLTVAALKAEGVHRLRDAPGYAFHLGTGDSLLYGKDQGELFDAGLAGHQYAAEDLDDHPSILKRGRYHVVVGNPPYITVKDKALNDAYRRGYDTCSGKYALSVPFVELFFRLAVNDPDRPGYVGQITSNSFIKREFGRKLIEDFLPSQDLTHVIDTSGAYIPGHGTPTVILVGRRRIPRSQNLRGVLGVRGEPDVPADAARGLVWRSIVENLRESGFENEWVSIVDISRDRLATHPWSLSGGGAAELMELIEAAAESRIGDHTARIGFFGITGADELLLASDHVWEKRGLAGGQHVRRHVAGEDVRDWAINPRESVAFPYAAGELKSPLSGALLKFYWNYRAFLESRKTFAGVTYKEAGRAWWEWHQLPGDANASPYAIAYGQIASHNHFAFSKEAYAYNSTATILKLPAGASVELHRHLEALMNLSVTAFWLKQVCFNKGGDPMGDAGARISKSGWEDRFAFNAANVADIPVPSGSLASAEAMGVAVESAAAASPLSIGVWPQVPSRGTLAELETNFGRARGRALALQEEMDWDGYNLFGLTNERLCSGAGELPGLNLGERAFEIVLARKAARGEADLVWFERHRSTPITEIPAHWPEDYRALVQRRISLIETNPSLRLLERPECKRRWTNDPWEVKQQRALRGWLLHRLEDEQLWRGQRDNPTTQSVAQLAGRLASDEDFLSVLEFWAGRSVSDVAKEIGRLVSDEHVPYLAAYRYKPAGLRKREEWERTWELQRREDAGEAVGTIPIPPKYVTGDFVKTSFWKHRGKLDVPKERFISYPGGERGADNTLVLGWAGWDHAEQAMALATLVVNRQSQDGWEADRVTPLLAGVAELEPWVTQWHAETDPRMGMSPAQAVTATLEQQLARLHLTRDDLAAWLPPAPVRGSRSSTKKA